MVLEVAGLGTVLLVFDAGVIGAKAELLEAAITGTILVQVHRYIE